MQQSTIRFLLISSFAALFLSSCSSALLAGFQQQTSNTKSFTSGYFANAETDYIYKAALSAYGHDLSGILIIKQIEDKAHRVVFTTEFGNRLFDFEISQDHFKVNYILEDLNRKIILKILEQDFRLMLQADFTIDAMYADGKFNVMKSAVSDRNNYLYLRKDDGRYARLMHATKRKEKLSIYFTSENDIFADTILIQHADIKLRIVLNRL